MLDTRLELAISATSKRLGHARQRPGVEFLRKDEIARTVLESPLTLRKGTLSAASTS
jgi:hypothetical protein